MDKAAAIARIREQLTQGEIEAALQLLIQELEPQRTKLRELSNRALQAKAQLEKTQKDELQGVISFENSKLSYNQLSQQIIGLVDEWENPTSVSTTTSRKFSPQMILVAIMLLAFVGIIGFKLVKKGGKTSIANACPEFDKGSTFNILVLPFYILNMQDITSPHKPIVRRLDRFKQEFAKNIKTSVRGRKEPAPENDQLAIKSGERCAAQLVIWGEAEKLSSDKDETVVITNYKYLASGKTFEFTKFTIDEKSEVGSKMDFSNIKKQGLFVDTISNYSSIITKGELTDLLENEISLLFGVAVMQEGDAQGAIEILEATTTNDVSSSMLKNMALAESHLQNRDSAKAVASYNKVLEDHPNYWFALNNRAILYYQKGDYEEALKNLNQKLDEEPENVEALTVRGAVRIKTEQFKEAEEDLNKAKRNSAADTEKQRYIQKKIDLLNEAKTKEEERKIRANNLLKKNPENINALVTLAEANRNLGDYQEADKFATKALVLDRQNIEALAVKVETTSKLNKSKKEINIVKNQIRSLDAKSRDKLIEARPVLGRMISRN